MSVVFFAQFDEENLTLSEHTCLTNHTIGWDESKTITTNRRHQRLCLETASQLRPCSFQSWRWRLTTWGLFTPRQKKGQRISEHIKGPLVAVITSPLMKALDRSVHQTVSDLKFSKVLLNKLCWTRNTVIFDGKLKVETYIKIIFPIRFK